MKVVPPTPDRIERLIRTAIRTFEEQFFQDTLEKLPTASLSKLDSLVDRIAFLDEHQDGPSSDKVLLSFHELKADPGKPGVESVLREVSKLRTIRKLELPDDDGCLLLAKEYGDNGQFDRTAYSNRPSDRCAGRTQSRKGNPE